MTYDPMQTGEVQDAIDSLRAKVVRIAEAEIGDQRKGSPIVRDYMKECVNGICDDSTDWCGIFALWCYRQAGITSVKWQVGSGFALRCLPRYENLTGLWVPPGRRGARGDRLHFDPPQPGDLFVGNHAPYHHGIVVRRWLEGSYWWLESIEGNTPDVRRRNCPAPKGITYYSILPWLKQSLGILQ